jgi:CRP-like cAMP-binding protein
MPDFTKQLASLPLFQSLNPDQLDWLAKRTEYLLIGAGNYFYDNTAAPENFFYVLIEGEWLVTRQVLGSGREITRQGGTPGAWHGGLEFFETIAPARARAVTDCKIARVHQEVMIRLVGEVPGLAKHLLAGYVVGMSLLLEHMD